MKISNRTWIIDFFKSLADFLIVLCIGMLIDYIFSEAPSMAPALLIIPYIVLLIIRRIVKSFPLMCVLHILVILPMLCIPVLIRAKTVVVGMTIILSILSFYYRTHTDSKATYADLGQRLLILGIAAFFTGGAYRELYLVTVIATGVCFVIIMHINNINDSFSLISKNQQHEKGYVIMNNNKIMTGFVILVLLVGLVLPSAADLTVSLLSRIPNPFENLYDAESDIPRETLPPLAAEGDGFDYSQLDSIPTNGVVVAILRTLLLIMMAGIGLALVFMLLMMIRGIFEYFYGKRFPTDTQETIMPEFLQTLNLRRKSKMQMKMPMNRIRRMYFKKVSEQINRGVKVQKFNTPNEIKSLIMQNEDISELTEMYNEARYGAESNS